MMNQPAVFIKPDHCHVAQNSSVFLVYKMPGNMRILCIEFLVRIFYLFSVCLEKGIFFGINKSRFKKEIPKLVQIHLIADISVSKGGDSASTKQIEFFGNMIKMDLSALGMKINIGKTEPAV